MSAQISASPEPQNASKSILKPYVLSHGTCECYNLSATRRFYEEFLGLECIRIAPHGLIFSLGMKFHVVCLQVGDQVRPLGLRNHWGLEVETAKAVEDAYERANEAKDKYQIRQVLSVATQDGRYSFYLEDLDHNWWEIQYYDGCMYDDFKAFGDFKPEQEET
jgi:hypothetical protein